MPRKISETLLLNKFSYSDATHLLYCRHCIGQSCSHYTMRCVLISETDSGKVKVIVFGDRNWAGNEHIKRIRYVEKNRIKPINNPQAAGDDAGGKE